jgi:citrate/tricarballylate utilization protein
VPPLTDLMAEGERVLVICNSCRYCEGFCAVFPAMERRLSFKEGDINYLANLCHNCAECYYACQYAPPHEFAVNVPKVFAEIRARSYRKYAWPAYFPVNGWVAGGVGLLAALALAGTRSSSDANFYGVVPHDAMVATFLLVSACIVVVQVAGLLRFWRESGEGLLRFFQPRALIRAARDVFSLRNLDSDGVGCTYPDERHSGARRRFHHATFYGFLLCLASTSVAAVYHYAGWLAPYGYFSLPVVLGTAGGLGLLVGPAGLYALKRRRDPAIGDLAQDGSDVSFMALLVLTSLTGLLLLIFRETPAMGALLRVHLGVVLGLLLTIPYGKFVHGIYRSAALVRSALESTPR